MLEKITINGACHCGEVSFTALVNKDVEVLVCNCSICSACGFEHLIVPHQDFKLVTGKDSLTEYRFGTQTAVHLFCNICGIKSFYQPRSHPDAYSINTNCVENMYELNITQKNFDGRNWEKSRAKLKD